MIWYRSSATCSWVGPPAGGGPENPNPGSDGDAQSLGSTSSY